MGQPNDPFFLGPEQATCACLLIHGFSGTPAEMYGLGEALAADGIRVYGMQVAGHSGDPEALIASGRKQWLASAEEGLTKLAGHRYVVVIGLSMGGVLALQLAIRHPERIIATVALSTPTRFSGGWQVKIVPLARYFVKWFYPLANLNFKNPKVQAEVLKQAQLRDPDVQIDFTNPETVNAIKQMVRLPIPALAELFALTDKNRRQLARVYGPLLIIHSRRDQTVAPTCAEELDQLTTSAAPKSLHWLESSGHVITTDNEHQKVYALVRSFIATTVPGDAVQLRSEAVQMGEPDETHPES